MKTLVDQLTDDILGNLYFHDLYNKCAIISAEHNLKNPKISTLSIKEFKDSLRFADILSNSSNANARNKAYQIITYLNPSYSQNVYYKTVSKAVYSKLGNFPAIQYLEQNDNAAKLPFLNAIESDVKKVIQSVPQSEGLVFTDAQFELYSKLNQALEFSFSGPTSMGKSFMIKAFIKQIMNNTPKENLVLIVPTRALINQFSIDLREELGLHLERHNYKVVVNSSVSDLTTEIESNYIFVLTPERLISYLSQDNNPPVGFLFVDEAHKLASHKDSRSVTTYTAVEKTLRKFGNVKLYFSSPNVSNPEIFLNLFNRNPANVYKTNESPVTQNLFFLNLIDGKATLINGDDEFSIDSKHILPVSGSVSDVIKVIGRKNNNLIYCNSKNRTIRIAYSYIENESKITLTPNLRKAIKNIKAYIHKDYYLAELLEYGVAFHYGKLPQLIRNLIEDLYKNEIITNVFCTSTLLEGVNMPTQNIFILDNRNGNKKLEPIDFWNLSGRAGRLSKELSGNIFCVQYDECEWDNKAILKKQDIKLEPTVTSKIDKNLIKIEKLLTDKDISGTEEEKYILRYVANIICLDTLEIESNYKSPLIDKLIAKNKDKIVKLAKEKVQNFEIPKHILGFNQSINLSVQNEVYKKLKAKHQKGQNIKLPGGSQIDYQTCKSILQDFYKLYEWEKYESKLKNVKSLNYFALLINKWVNGASLSQIISQSLDYNEANNLSVGISATEFVPFVAGNKQHINIVIENIIDDIEYILRFLFEKYFNHYYQILVQILGENNAGENWATLLEYGTQNRIVIALQNIGLSRNTALLINNKFKSYLIVDNGKLTGIKKASLLTALDNDSLEYDEVRRIL